MRGRESEGGEVDARRDNVREEAPPWGSTATQLIRAITVAAVVGALPAKMITTRTMATSLPSGTTQGIPPPPAHHVPPT